MRGSNQEHLGAVVIGGGQAGLSVGYHLRRHDVPFVILDAAERVGDAWRNRWDSLRLFTPARYDGLDGMPFPAPPRSFPTKDEMADYLEHYADTFELPVTSDTRVERLSRENGRFVVETADRRRFEADNVVVAMSGWQRPRIPIEANDLDPGIRQLHTVDYRNPSQLQDGDVLVVGAGNSGAEIALDVSGTHRTLLAGPDTGHIPFRLESAVGRVMAPLVLRVVFHRILTTGTPIGRRARPKKLAHGEPLVRTKPSDLAAAGIERVPRVIGTRDGMPLLEDERTVDVANVVWCTGFEPGFSWIDLPVLEGQLPTHHNGVVESHPGLFFVGLKFLYSVSSAEVHGVGRDAERIARAVAARQGGHVEKEVPA